MIDPTLKTASLLALETAIRQALSLDSGTRARLAEQAGRCFAIHIIDLELELFILLTGTGIELRSHYEDKVTTRVRGPLAAFIKVIGSSDKGVAMINSGLELTGSSQPLLDLQQALAQLDLDWEAKLAPLIGDIPTHLLGQGVRHLWQFGQRLSSSFARHLEEYLHEEARLLPGRDELEDFYEDIANLRERSERLQARMERLRQQITDTASKG